MNKTLLIALSFLLLPLLLIGQTDFETHVIDIGGMGSVNLIKSVDFNQDGLTDVIATSDSYFAWFENLGDNEFKKHPIGEEDVRHLEVVDIDQDGDNDFVIIATFEGNDIGSNLKWLENLGNGDFRSHFIKGTRNAAENYSGFMGNLVITDVNVDGYPDIVINEAIDDYDDEFETGLVRFNLQFFLNDQQGEFERTRLATEEVFRSSAFFDYEFGDLDGDNDLDVVIIEETDDNYELYWREFTDDSYLFQSLPESSDIITGDVILSDIDEDGDLDIGTLRASSGDRFYYENEGPGLFTKVFSNETFTSEDDDPGVDLDGDGDLDIITGFRWEENLGNGEFAPEVVIDSFLVGKSSRYADTDNDGDIDFIVADVSGTDELFILVNDGNLNFSVELLDGDELSALNADAVDLDLDGDIDILASSRDGRSIFWHENDGAQNFTKIIIDEDITGPIELQAADFDNDGDVDFVVSSYGQKTLYLYRNQGDMNFEQESIATFEETGPVFILTIDYDEDGDKDFLLSTGLNGTIELFTNIGDGLFNAFTLFSLERTLYFDIGDVNSDGLLDIVCGDFATNELFLYKGDNDGSYNKTLINDSIPFIYDIHLVDMDLDEDLDIIFASALDDDELFWLANEGNDDFTEQPLSIDQYGTIEAWDFDNDGDIDLATGNYTIPGNLGSTHGLKYWENDGANNYSLSTLFNNDTYTTEIFTVDLDLDSDQDILALSSTNGTIWYENIESSINNNDLSIECPDDIMITTAPGEAFAAWQPPVVNTTCTDGIELTQTGGPALGENVSPGTYEISYSVFEFCDPDNPVTCSFNFVVAFETELSIACPDDIIVMTSSDFATVNWDQPTVVSNCSEGFDIETLGDLFQDNQYPLGLYTVEFFVTDNCTSEPVTCSFDIVVEQVDVEECSSQLTGYEFLGELNGHKYFLSQQKMNWSNAQAAAKNAGGYLASINNPEENNFIYQNISELAFIGVSDVQTEGNFNWDSNETIDFNNLEGANNQWVNFGYLQFWNGGWGLSGPFAERKFIVEIDCANFVACSMEANILEEICFDNGTSDIDDDGFLVSLLVEDFGNVSDTWTSEINGQLFTGSYGTTTELGPLPIFAPGQQITVTIDDENGSCSTFAVINVPEPCPGESACPDELEGFTSMGSFGNSSYFLSNQKFTWREAQAEAIANGGYLTSINNAAENSFLANQSFDIFFIGINDERSEGTFTWVNNDMVSYTNYSSCFFCPVNSEENDFGTMNFWDGSWNFESEFVERRFIMEIDCQPTIASPGIVPRMSKPTTLDNEIKLFPNPAMDWINIMINSSTAEEENIVLIDARGTILINNKIQLKTGDNRSKFDVSNLPDGFYFLKFNSTNEIRKFVKKGFSFK